MTTTSPQSSYIIFPDEIDNKYFALKTQPLYSIFYYMDTINNTTNIPTQIQNRKRNNLACKNYSNKQLPYAYEIMNDIPFNLTTNNGKKNLYFLLTVFMTSIIIGTITFYYWSYLLGDTILDQEFKTSIERRSIFLSILFLVMILFFSILLYEFFTLRTSSLRWLAAYQSGQPYNFYNFVMNTRKIVLWVFMILWLSVVIFITITISKRPQQFKNIIAMNVMSGMMLLIFQYLYYNTSYQMIKTFCIFISAFIIGLTMFLLYEM